MTIEERLKTFKSKVSAAKAETVYLKEKIEVLKIANASIEKTNEVHKDLRNSGNISNMEYIRMSNELIERQRSLNKEIKTLEREIDEKAKEVENYVIEFNHIVSDVLKEA